MRYGLLRRHRSIANAVRHRVLRRRLPLLPLRRRRRRREQRRRVRTHQSLCRFRRNSFVCSCVGGGIRVVSRCGVGVIRGVDRIGSHIFHDSRIRFGELKDGRQLGSANESAVEFQRPGASAEDGIGKSLLHNARHTLQRKLRHPQVGRRCGDIAWHEFEPHIGAGVGRDGDLQLLQSAPFDLHASAPIDHGPVALQFD